MQGICCRHGFYDKGGGEEGHEGKEDDDDGRQCPAGLVEGGRQSEGSRADDQVEDVNKAGDPRVLLGVS